MRRAPIISINIFIVAACILAAHMVRAQIPQLAPASANVQVKQWIILIADPYRIRASTIFAAGNSLPAFVDTLRSTASGAIASEPCPIGVIRFFGQTDQKISVKVSTRGGTFYGAWPTARIRADQVQWNDLSLSSTPGRLAPIDPNHWLAALRSGPAAYLTTAGWSEQFLLYDVELPFVLPLKLVDLPSSDQTILPSNIGTTPLHDLILYRHDSRLGWLSGSLTDLPPELATTRPQESQMVEFAPVGGDPSQFLLKEWRARLASFELDESDLAVIVRALKAQALNESAITAVFRLDADDLDRLLPMEITPYPVKIQRLGLVIARDIDPDLPRRIDELIAQLGDPDWHKREAASQALARYGSAADSKLRAALVSHDLEIVARAERLLAASKNR